MPLWRIFSHPQTFNPEQRLALSKSITDLYVSRGLPAFYVNVIFIDVDESSVFIGGEPRKNFVRIAIEQIARTMPEEFYGRWMDMISETLKPHIHSRPELEWEHHIYETPRRLWRVQDLDAPPAESEAEKRWLRENKATPWRWVGEGDDRVAV